MSLIPIGIPYKGPMFSPDLILESNLREFSSVCSKFKFTQALVTGLIFLICSIIELIKFSLVIFLDFIKSIASVASS